MNKPGYSSEGQKRPRRRGFRSRFARKIIIIALVFGLGLALGRGSTNLSPDAIFRRPVSKDLPQDLDYTSAEELYDALKESYDGQLEGLDLLDGLKQGLVRASGDPYTEYLNEQESKDFDGELKGTFEGIGAELVREEDFIIIVSPISGYPAEKAGLRPHDVIIEIDGQNAYNLSLTEAVKRIRGPKGTSVKLKIVRDRKEELTFEITRERINIPSVTSEILEGGIGYLKISRFGDDTVELSRAAASIFKSANVRGVILDVRGDPGGLLDASVDVASLWLEKQTVLQEKRGTVVVNTFKSRGTATLKGIPTVVLIDEGSASASEIVAGALKDNKAARIVGQKSFGKGSVQELRKLAGGGQLKVTIARWYTPGGQNIDKEGIEPDISVERSAEDIKNKLDPQKDKALELLKN